jgi:glycosyltransferase involved in cell wall biosynthesis
VRVDRPLRVLLDGSPLRDGRSTAGIGRYVNGISEALRHIDSIEVEVAVPPPPVRDSWLGRYATAQPWLAWAALRSRPLLVHGLASDPVAGFPLRRQVTTVHDVIPWTRAPEDIGRRTAWYLAAQRRRLRSVAAVIAVSPGVAGDVTTTLGVPAERVHVVPNGVGAIFTPDATDRDDELRRAAGVAPPYLLWVGSLRHHDARKALDVVVDAAAALRERVSLVLVGAAGTESERVGRLAAERGVTTVCTGYVPDPTLAALYRGAAALLLPSHEEGFGLPALEAMASSTPVITTRGGNTAAVAAEAALLVTEGDAADLARAAGAVLDDPGLAHRLGVAGRRRAEAYSWRRSAELTVEVYDRVARSVGGPRA